jgi:sugar transferase EpsL
MFYSSFIKPFIDKLIAISTIGCTAPLFLLISIVNYALYKNVFFIQERTGLHMKPFQLIKFQTMRTIQDEHGVPLADMKRVTGFGKLLRITSIDELPQLFLVLTGKMSLVGPRPLPVSYDCYYTEEQRLRFEAKPGITGLAQVNGRNATSWESRFQFDSMYIKNRSFRLDMLILVKTFFQLMKFNEVNASDSITMKPFKN